MTTRAAAVIIGNEVLSGKVRDENTPFLIRELRDMGVELVRIEVVPDELDAIAGAVARASAIADFAVTSGGVGPTHDDVTMESVSRAFQVPLEEHPELTRMLEGIDRPGKDALRRMALVPRGSELIFLEGFPWPLVLVRNVYILPGIPWLFRRKFASIRSRHASTPVTCKSVYVTLTEAELVPSFEALLRTHPAVAVGSYPRTENTPWSVRVTVEHLDPGAVDAAVGDFLLLLPPTSILEVRSDG